MHADCFWIARNLPGYIAGYKVSSGRWRHRFTWCHDFGDRPRNVGKRSATSVKCHSSVDLSLIISNESGKDHNEKYQAQRRHHHPCRWLWHRYVLASSPPRAQPHQRQSGADKQEPRCTSKNAPTWCSLLSSTATRTSTRHRCTATLRVSGMRSRGGRASGRMSIS